MDLAVNYLKNQAIEALNLGASGVRKNMCDTVANEFGYTLENRHDVTVETVKAPVQGAKHFVSILESTDVIGYPDEGYVIVDATIRQFNDRFDEELPDVLVLGPNDEWSQYYDRVNV